MQSKMAPLPPHSKYNHEVFKNYNHAIDDHATDLAPRGDAGGLSREYVLRIPSVS